MESEHTRQDEAVQRLTESMSRFKKSMNGGMTVLKELSGILGSISAAFEDIAAATTEPENMRTLATSLNNGGYATEPGTARDLSNSMSQTSLRAAAAAASSPASPGQEPLTNDNMDAEFQRMSAEAFQASMMEFRAFVTGFSAEVKYLREGTPFMEYNDGIHHSVLKWLKVVEEEMNRTSAACRRRRKAYSTYTTIKKKVEDKEKKYINKKIPIIKSKHYPKQVEKREAALQAYKEEKAIYNTQFETLMKRNAVATMRSVKKYLALTAGYLRSVVASMERTDRDLGSTPEANSSPLGNGMDRSNRLNSPQSRSSSTQPNGAPFVRTDGSFGANGIPIRQPSDRNYTPLTPGHQDPYNNNNNQQYVPDQRYGSDGSPQPYYAHGLVLENVQHASPPL